MANGSRNTGWIPVLVAVVTVGLFIGWLATRERATPVAVQEPDTTEAETPDTGPAAQTVPLDSMAKPGFVRGLVGQHVRLEGVQVSTAMGSNFFWIELPGGAPYMVKMDSTLMAAGTAPPTSGRVTVVGEVRPKNAATLDQWLQGGVLESEDHKLQAEFGSSYIEARRVQPAGN